MLPKPLSISVLIIGFVLLYLHSVSSSYFSGGFISGLKNAVYRKDSRGPRPFGFHIRKVYGKLALYSKCGAVVHISVGETGLVVQKLKGKPLGHLPADRYSENVDGIFGFYKLPAGYFAAFVKSSKPATVVPLSNIHVVQTVKLLKVPSSVPVSESYLHLNATELELEQARAETLLLHTFKQHTFYFSTGSYDISKTLQSNTQTADPEEKFFWNLNAIAPLVENNCTEFVTPVVNAWIGTTNIRYDDADYLFTLISRRSRRRQGPR